MALLIKGSQSGLHRAAAPAPDRLIAFGYSAALIAVALQSTAHLVNVYFFDKGIWNLSADTDSNSFAWASCVATFTAALMVLVLAWLEPARRGRFLGLSAALAFFSLDDIVRIHEQSIGISLDVAGITIDHDYGRSIWPVLYLPLLVAAFIGLWQLARTLLPPAARTVRVGLVLLALAVADEAFSGVVHAEDRLSGTWIDSAQVVTEEGLELAGFMLIATALAAHVLAVLAPPPALDADAGPGAQLRGEGPAPAAPSALPASAVTAARPVVSTSRRDPT